MPMKKTFFVITALWVALLAGRTTTQAGEIAGTVALSGQPVGNAVLSIEGLRQEGDITGKVFVIDHHNLDFVPHVLVVRVGEKVRFENSDGMPCRIYSISPAGNFVLRRHDGNPVTITFDRPGVIELRCADHERIHAYVLVKENSFFALTDAQGRYVISNVPQGRYTLQAWYEGKVVAHKAITVSAAKQKINFKAQRPPTERAEGQRLDSLAPASSASGASNSQSEFIYH